MPKVGGGLDPSLEAIIALQPDVVLLSRATRWGSVPRALGVRTVVLDARRVAEVQHMIVTIAALVHQPAAGAQLWQQLQAGLDGVAQRLPPTIAGGAACMLKWGKGRMPLGPVLIWVKF